jgi:DNA-binding MarR family transcriptional regulator
VGRRLDWPPLETQILAALRQRGPMTRSEIAVYHVRPCDTPSKVVRETLEQMEAAGLVRSWKRPDLRRRGKFPSVYYGVTGN